MQARGFGTQQKRGDACVARLGQDGQPGQRHGILDRAFDHQRQEDRSIGHLAAAQVQRDLGRSVGAEGGGKGRRSGLRQRRRKRGQRTGRAGLVGVEPLHRRGIGQQGAVGGPGVACRRPAADLAHHGQLPGAVIGVDDPLAIRALHRAEPSGPVAFEGHQNRTLVRDRRVADPKHRAIGEGNGADRALTGDAICRAIRAGQGEEGRAGQRRVPWLCAIRVEEAATGKRQVGCRRGQGPARAAGIRREGRPRQGAAAEPFDLGPDGKADARAARQCQLQAAARGHALWCVRRAAARRAGFDLDIHALPGGDPARPQLPRATGLKRIVAAGQGKAVAGHLDRRVDLGQHGAVRRRSGRNLDIRFRHALPSVQVHRAQRQPVEPVGKLRRIDPCLRTGPGFGARGKQDVPARQKVAGGQAPFIQRGVLDAAQKIDGSGDRGVARRRDERQDRRRGIGRIADAQDGFRDPDRAVFANRLGPDDDAAGDRGGERQLAVGAQCHGIAVDQNAGLTDPAQAFGQHLQGDLLPRRHREIGRRQKGDGGGLGCGGDPDQQRAPRLCHAVGDGHVEQGVAHLIHTRCPGQHAGHAVELRSGRQAFDPIAQRVVFVRIGAGHGHDQRVAQGGKAVLDRQGGRAIDVVDDHPHRHLAARARGVDGSEGQVVGAGIAETGCPADDPGARVEIGPGRQGCHGFEEDRVGIRIAAQDREGQGLALQPPLRWQGCQNGRGVGVRHLDRDRFGI